MTRALGTWQKDIRCQLLSELGDTQRWIKAHQKQRPGNFESPCCNITWLSVAKKRLWRNECVEKLFVFGRLEINWSSSGGEKELRMWLWEDYDLCWLFFFPLSSSLETLYYSEEVLLQVELFKAALRDCSTVTGINYPFMNFVPREHLFLFGVLLGIDFDSHLS